MSSSPEYPSSEEPKKSRVELWTTLLGKVEEDISENWGFQFLPEMELPLSTTCQVITGEMIIPEVYYRYPHPGILYNPNASSIERFYGYMCVIADVVQGVYHPQALFDVEEYTGRIGLLEEIRLTETVEDYTDAGRGNLELLSRSFVLETSEEEWERLIEISLNSRLAITLTRDTIPDAEAIEILVREDFSRARQIGKRLKEPENQPLFSEMERYLTFELGRLEPEEPFP